MTRALSGPARAVQDPRQLRRAEPFGLAGGFRRRRGRSRTFENLAAVWAPRMTKRKPRCFWSRRSDFIYGHSLVVDGGVMATANFPKSSFRNSLNEFVQIF